MIGYRDKNVLFTSVDIQAVSSSQISAFCFLYNLVIILYDKVSVRVMAEACPKLRLIDYFPTADYCRDTPRSSPRRIIS